MATVFYTRCRCPHCKAKLDDVRSDCGECPLCRRELESSDVWNTRIYPGMLSLPPWIRAFGWPFLLMATGIGIMLASYFGSGETYVRVPVGMIVTGMIWFFFMLSGGDDE